MSASSVSELIKQIFHQLLSMQSLHGGEQSIKWEV